jgi:hypothetical protein
MSAAWPVASDHLRSGARESAEFPTEVKEVLAMFAEGGRKNRVVPEERIFHVPL